MYRHPIEACDVEDRDRLCQFREKRAEWVSMMRGDDPHAIWEQITELLWDDTLFRTVNDLRRRSAEQPSEDVGFNGWVARLLDMGFIAKQVTTIRRLTDPKPPQATKNVISLRRLISDIKASRELITREMYVAHDGLPYDPAPGCDAWIQRRLTGGVVQGTDWQPAAGSGAWGSSEVAHEQFDKLSGIGPDTRSRSDSISPQWFDWLESQLAVCADVRKYTDKFIAHAAEPASRVGLTESQSGITLNRLRECQRAIYRVAAFIYGPLLWEGSYGAVPTPQDDHLEHLEKGWVEKDALDEAHVYWNRHREAVEEFESGPMWPDATAENPAT